MIDERPYYVQDEFGDLLYVATSKESVYDFISEQGAVGFKEYQDRGLTIYRQEVQFIVTRFLIIRKLKESENNLQNVCIIENND